MENPKKLYRLKGYIKDTHIAFDERVQAYSGQQARLLLHRRLEKFYPHIAIFPRYEIEEVEKVVKARSSAPKENRLLF